MLQHMMKIKGSALINLVRLSNLKTRIKITKISNTNYTIMYRSKDYICN